MVLILSVSSFQEFGLNLAGFDTQRQNRVCKKTNVDRFRAFYGSNPVVCAQIWEDLQTALLPEDRINPIDRNDVKCFLMSLRFLKAYPIENDLAGNFNFCDKTVRKHVWFYISKLQDLKNYKIIWPENWNRNSPEITNDIFLASVDGVHCRINEPRHPTLSKNPQFYSHKFNQAAVGYEIGVSLFSNSIVWVNGPYPAAKSDLQIFRDCGLKDIVPDTKKLIGDKGYRGEKEIIATANSHDDIELRKFKSRSRSRHETINSRFKSFRILDVRFRHGVQKHKAAFEAVSVICQYQLENGSPLFDV